MKADIKMITLVKPSTPTPSYLRYYKISFIDELAPTINVPLVLYYPAPPKAQDGDFTYVFDHLEKTLSETLCEFYPLAGRYIRGASLIDCSDQGVGYIKAKVSAPLSEILSLGQELKPDLINIFLPCEIGEADEIDDPMVSFKVTTFQCGGFAIGMCFSHRLSDMGTMCAFINNWAARSKGVHALGKYSPIFNSTQLFPHRGLPKLELRVPRSSIGVKNDARRFLFNGKAISSMRKKVGYEGNDSRKPSKVQLVVALLWKAFVRIDKVNTGQSKRSFLIQPVGLRDKIVPPLPINSFGNFWGLATSQLGRGQGENIDFQGFFELLCDSVRQVVKDCSKILTHGEEGYGVVINPYLQANQHIVDTDVSFYLFTCWCKFSFYEADFGWGKTIWASTGKLPVQNLVIMLDDREGDGVEAWVHLDEKSMAELEQDSDIKAYAV